MYVDKISAKSANLLSHRRYFCNKKKRTCYEQKNDLEKCRLPMFRKAKSSNRQYFSRAEKSVLDIGKDV